MKLIRGFMLGAAAALVAAVAMVGAPAIAPPGPEPSSAGLAVTQMAIAAMDVAAFVIGAVFLIAFGVALARETVSASTVNHPGPRLEPYSRRIRSILPRASPSHYLTPT
jgi:hypothetical protein